jgi:hypothetical protein
MNLLSIAYIPSSEHSLLIYSSTYIRSFVTPVHGNSFNFTSITIQETIDALNQIKSKNSPGLDGISTRSLKDATNIIAGPLVNIFNVSFQRAIFPNDWKLAKVTPVFKEGNKADCGNYRPISVISVVAKLFEKLVYQQLRSFMTLNNILVEQQFGFRPQHSTDRDVAIRGGVTPPPPPPQ